MKFTEKKKTSRDEKALTTGYYRRGSLQQILCLCFLIVIVKLDMLS